MVTERESSYSDPDTYRETRFVSKFRPVLRRTEEGIEVWTSSRVQSWRTSADSWVDVMCLAYLC